MSNTAILILNYNGWQDTINCINSLLPIVSSEDFIFVTDNGSSDHSVMHLEAFFLARATKFQKCDAVGLSDVFTPTIRYYLVVNKENLGFGSGNNLVLKTLSSLQPQFELAWLLNNDTEVTDNSLVNLKKPFSADARIGAAGSLILNLPGDGRVQCAGVDYFPLLGISKLVNKNMEISKLRSRIRRFDYINGASLMLSLKALENTGYFDERFFLYSEELDLQLRLQKKGYRLQLVHDGIVYHRLGAGTRQSRHLFYYFYNKSAVLLTNKHYSPLVRLCVVINLSLITFIRTFPVLKNFSWGIKGIVNGLKS